MSLSGLAGDQRDGSANSYVESGPLYEGAGKGGNRLQTCINGVTQLCLTIHQSVIQLN